MKNPIILLRILPVFIVFMIIMSMVLVTAEGDPVTQPQTSTQSAEPPTIESGSIPPGGARYMGILVEGEGVKVGSGSISGYAHLPELGNIGVENINGFQSSENGFSGVAGSPSSVAGVNLEKGTKFKYDKNTGELQIDDGGAFCPRNTGRDSMLRVSGNKATVSKDGTVSLPKGAKLTDLDRNSPVEWTSKYTVITSNSDDTKVRAEGYNRDINGYWISGSATTTDDEGRVIEINGGGHVYFDTKKHRITKVDFDNTGTSKVSYTYNVPAYSEEKSRLTYSSKDGFSSKRETEYKSTDLTNTFSNKVFDPTTGEPKNVKMAVVFDGWRLSGQDYDGVVYENHDLSFLSHEPKRSEIVGEGMVSIRIGETFQYEGLNRDSKANIRSLNGLSNLQITPTVHQDGKETPTARVDWGNRVEYFGSKDGKLSNSLSASSLFDPDDSNTISINHGSIVQVQNDGKLVLNGNNPKGTVITYPPIDNTVKKMFTTAEDENGNPTTFVGKFFKSVADKNKEDSFNQFQEDRKIYIENFERELKKWPSDLAPK